MSNLFLLNFQKIQHFESLSLLLIYFEGCGKESGLEGLLKEIGFKSLEEKLRQIRERGEGIKKEFKLKE